MIRLIFILIAVIALFSLSYTNSEESVVVRYFGGWSSQPIRLDVLILTSFLSGAALAVILVLPGWIRLWLHLRRKSRSVEQLESERDRLRAIQREEGPSVPRPGGIQADPEDS